MVGHLASFVDELTGIQKVATKSEEQANEEAKLLAGAALAASGLVGAFAADAGGKALGHSLQKTLMTGTLPVQTVAEGMGITAPLVTDAPKFGYASPKMVKGEILRELKAAGASKREIAAARRAGIVMGPAGRGPELVAHEVGHAANASKNKLLTTLANRKFYKHAPVMGMVVGGMVAVAPEDAEDFAVKAAPAVPLLLQAPVLADEALASIRGFKGMKALGTYSSKVLKRAKGNLIKAYGTYLLTAVGSMAPVAAVSASRIVKKRMGDKKEKTSSVGSGLSSLFARAYKEDKNFRKKVHTHLSTDPNRRRKW